MTLTDNMSQEKKKEEDLLALKTTLTHRLEDYTEKCGGRLITATRWALTQFLTLPIVQTLLTVTFGYSLSSEAVVMRQLRRWKRLLWRSLTRSHKKTSMGPSRSCWNSKRVKVSFWPLIFYTQTYKYIYYTQTYIYIKKNSSVKRFVFFKNHLFISFLHTCIYFVLIDMYVSSLSLSPENLSGTRAYEWVTHCDSNFLVQTKTTSWKHIFL